MVMNACRMRYNNNDLAEGTPSLQEQLVCTKRTRCWSTTAIQTTIMQFERTIDASGGCGGLHEAAFEVSVHCCGCI
jgi:hypothetical protein